jgi:hypothetical protein
MYSSTDRNRPNPIQRRSLSPKQLKTISSGPIFARDELKKIARDPDSVVVEKTSDPELLPLKKNYGQMIGFLLQYRAKNGFGGYERESRCLICNVYGNNVRFLDRGQKP